MKYAIVAALLFIAGVTLAYVERKDQNFTPIVRVRATDGLHMTLVQPRTAKRNACNAVVDRFVEVLESTCPSCAVESSGCETRLEGIDRALADGERLPIYTVSAGGMRVGLLGPPHTVRAECEGMAAEFISKGMKTASCVAPVTEARPGGA